MAELIHIDRRRPGRDNLIASEPMEFRRGEWSGGFAILCTRRESERFEAHLDEAFSKVGHRHVRKVPNHIQMSEGYHFTTLGLFRHRHSETHMKRLYRLAGLMECVTNASSPILRTDLLRRIYQVILDERQALSAVWRGNVSHFLLPLYSEHYNRDVFFHRLREASSLHELFEVVDEETSDQFLLLTRHYVLYVPDSFMELDAAT